MLHFIEKMFEIRWRIWSEISLWSNWFV